MLYNSICHCCANSIHSDELSAADMYNRASLIISKGSSTVQKLYLVSHACRWEAIQQTGELRRMSRTHIHFASKPYHMRTNTWATVMLKLDLERALNEGIKVWRSSNGVVLAEGPIPVKLLSLVTKEQLLSESTIQTAF